MCWQLFIFTLIVPEAQQPAVLTVYSFMTSDLSVSQDVTASISLSFVHKMSRSFKDALDCSSLLSSLGDGCSFPTCLVNLDPEQPSTPTSSNSANKAWVKNINNIITSYVPLNLSFVVDHLDRRTISLKEFIRWLTFTPASLLMGICVVAGQQRAATSPPNLCERVRVACSSARPPGQRVTVQQSKTWRVRWCFCRAADNPPQIHQCNSKLI